jgi:hypothetical protein
MSRELKLFVDFEVDDIHNPEIQAILDELERRLDRSHGGSSVTTEGHCIHLGAGYADNNRDYTDWLFQAMSRLAKHTDNTSLECRICDANGDWWSEPLYPAA